jgi:hypothetical protein
VVGVFQTYAERFDFGGIAKSIQNQVNAFFCEAFCDSEADSARRASDECRFAFKHFEFLGVLLKNKTGDWALTFPGGTLHV